MACFDFDKAAKLSHLDFTETEKQSFVKDMENILVLADTLCALDNVSITENTCPLITPLAKDEEENHSNLNLISQSKRNDGTYVVVPSIFE